jgi:hypothetical protein
MDLDQGHSYMCNILLYSIVTYTLQVRPEYVSTFLLYFAIAEILIEYVPRVSHLGFGS